MDDEVLQELCRVEAQLAFLPQLIQAREAAIRASVARGNDQDDWKSAAGEFYVSVRQLIGLQSPGNTSDAFLADRLAPLIRPGTATYEELRRDIFG